jgi:hypothetical protein
LDSSDDAVLTRNVIAHNTTFNGSGGGLALSASAARLDGNSMIDNYAYYYGGGLMLYSYSNALLLNNVVAKNRAGAAGSGVYVSGASPVLLHNTIANNVGGGGSGVYVKEEVIWGTWVIYSSVSLTNTIVSDQVVGVYASLGNTVTLESTLWHDDASNWDGDGVITSSGDLAGDPMFVSPTGGDYHIMAPSAARDVGVDAGVVSDVDGEARTDAQGHDVGADEFYHACSFLPGDMCAFYGDLHSHTGYSDGAGGSTPQQAFEMARGYGLDFFGTSDHGFLLSQEEWENTLVQAQAATEEGHFVALRGFEWTSGPGHINVFGTDNFVSACDPNYDELAEGYAWLSAPAQSGAVAQFDHPGITVSPCGRQAYYDRYGVRVESFARPWELFADPFDDLAYDAQADSRINLIELGNSAVEYLDEYHTALANGWHVGPTNNSDTHQANWGARRARVGVIAAELNEDEILDALRSRRTFSTEDENLVLAMQADGYWMGSSVPGGRTQLDIYVFDPGPDDLVDRLELYRNGELYASTPVESNQFVWRLTLPLFEASSWYAKAVQRDGDQAYSSPVWTMERSCWVRLNDDPTDYTTVQHAVDASTHPTDVVKIAGRCFRANASFKQVVYISKTLTLRGGYTVTNWSAYDPLGNLTILDGQGQGRVVHVAGNITPTIEGLHITGGSAVEPQQGTVVVGIGGGVYVEAAQAVLKNNWIHDNVAQYGGGVALVNSSAVVSGNVVRSNAAWQQGGGLYLEQSAAQVRGNVVVANTSQEQGGGVLLYRGSDAILTNNVIARNQAETAGSGVYVMGASPVLLHTTIADNDGGDRSGVHVTAVETGTLVFSSTVKLTNTIFSGHEVGVYVEDGNLARLGNTLWHNNLSNWSRAGGVEHNGDFTGDPAFVDPAGDDYHIGVASAARDVGADAGVVTDIDGEARPTVAGYDVGADEFWLPLLEVTQQAYPNPVQDGAPLTYTIRITNTGAVDLHATVVDTLPADVLVDESLVGTVLLPGGRFAWSPVITAAGGAWVQQVVVTTPLLYDEASVKIFSDRTLTNVVQVTTLEGVTGLATQTTIETWVRFRLYMPAAMQNYLPMRNVLPNPGFEGLGVPADNDAPNPGNWTRDTFNGAEYGEIFTPEGWVTWWEEGNHHRPEVKVIPREIPYTFDPVRIRQGYYAAMYFSMYSTHHAGYYQRVRDLPPGAPLMFYAYAHGWSCHGDVPLGYSCDNLENLGFYVGVDPDGGTDPWSSDVLWSERTPSPDVYRRIGPVETTVGPEGSVTVFLRSDTWWPFKHNDAYWDSAALMIPIP